MPKEDFTHTKVSTVVKDDGSTESTSNVTETLIDDDQEPNEQQDEVQEEGSIEANDAEIDKLAEEAEKTDDKEELALLKQRLDQLELENKALRESSLNKESTEKKPRTWSDLSLQELKTYRQNFRNEGDHDKADAINDIISEKIRDEAISKMETERQTAEARNKAWTETTEKYAGYAAKDPEFNLSNNQSKLFILADKIYAQNPHLKSIPTGESIAVEMAASELLKGKYDELGKTATSTKSALTKEQSKTSLEGAGRAATQTSSINRLMDEANKYAPGTAAHEKAWQKVMKEVNKQNR